MKNRIFGRKVSKMTDSQKVDAFIAKQTKWKEKLQQLRAIFKETELKEEVKWGKPTYTLDGKLVAALADFKNHMALWFHQGVFLKDKHSKLVNAQEGVTKALRQWRFEEEDKIDAKLVSEYINEAIANAKAGKEIKPVKKKEVSTPDILKDAMVKDKVLKESYNKLTPGRQREYAAYIGEAKREATQQNRLEKCSEMIKRGVGLHDKYKNC
ncbi:DUF1801 domain-containing protein [Aequorivita todarodis]|uniref:YdeI/OmpD-associated family protein n=1 Tax=Aequorivita todarodis TaxID=2036821 RepID=UPI002350A182|nr:DUF1801 domain-containing protein [Aequorivita todarodis]MDC8001258.1 DUF1801 domain-containing protein [Aequorivita todarodis]